MRWQCVIIVQTCQCAVAREQPTCMRSIDLVRTNATYCRPLPFHQLASCHRRNLPERHDQASSIPLTRAGCGSATTASAHASIPGCHPRRYTARTVPSHFVRLRGDILPSPPISKLGTVRSRGGTATTLHERRDSASQGIPRLQREWSTT